MSVREGEWLVEAGQISFIARSPDPSDTSAACPMNRITDVGPIHQSRRDAINLVDPHPPLVPDRPPFPHHPLSREAAIHNYIPDAHIVSHTQTCMSIGPCIALSLHTSSTITHACAPSPSPPALCITTSPRAPSSPDLRTYTHPILSVAVETALSYTSSLSVCVSSIHTTDRYRLLISFPRDVHHSVDPAVRDLAEI